MSIDNYVNNLCKLLNQVGTEYDTLMSKQKYQSARNEIKHFIQHDGQLVEKKDYPKFEDYCRQVFEKYLSD